MIKVELKDSMGKELARMAKLLREPAKPLKALGLHLERRWKKAMDKAPRRSIASAPEGEPPWRHRGDFSRSISSHLVKENAMIVGSDLVYGRILHEGGFVRKKDKLLTVPVDDKAFGKRAIDMDLDFIPLKDADNPWLRGLLVEPDEDDEGDVIWLLMEQVELREHPWATFEDEDEQAALDIFELALDREAGIK